MAERASRDVQLDGVALIKAHIEGDNDARGVLLDHCCAAGVADFLAAMIARWLESMAEREGMDPMDLVHGVDQVRANLSQDGD